MTNGFQRINTDSKSGGIIGIFRQGSNEDRRRVAVQWLDPRSTDHVKLAPGGETIITISGDDLLKIGFEVSIEEAYGAQIFEIHKL